MIGSMQSGGVREAEFAGILYPGDERTLLLFLERVLTDALPPEGKRGERRKVTAQGVFLPHGPYVYSAECAAATLAAVEIPDTALIIHPRTPTGKAHGRTDLPLSAMPGVMAWQTPFGNANVNLKLARALQDAGAAVLDEEVEAGEHAGEVVIPMLQMLNRELQVCVLSIGDGDAEQAKALGGAIARAVKTVGEESVLIVAVSDFHFGESRTRVEREDDFVLEQMELMSAPGLLDVVSRRETRISGATCLAVLIEAGLALGCTELVVQNHSDSGDVSGEPDDVVGYASGWIV